MKTCEKCGNRLPDTARFCNQCGNACEETVVSAGTEEGIQSAVAVIEKPQTVVQTPPAKVEISSDPTEAIGRFCNEEAEDSPKKVPRKKGRKILIITAAALILVLVLGIGTVLTVHYLSPQQRLLRAWDNGNYDDVPVILREDTALRSDREFQAQMKQRVEALTTSYQQGESDYDDTMAGLLAAENMKLSGMDQLLVEAMQSTAAIEISRGYFREAEALFEEGKQLEARSLYLQVIEQDRNYATARKRLTQCDEVFRQQVLEDARVQAEKGEYPAAISILQEAMYTLPEDSDLQRQLTDYEEQYALQQKNELLKQSEALAAEKDFIGAMELLSDSSDADIQAAYDGYYSDYITYIETTATEQTEAQDYCGAVETVQAAMEFAPEEERLKKALEDCVDEAINRSETLLEEKEYEQARTVVKELRSLLPGNKKLEAQLEKVDAETPLYLTDVSVAYDAVDHREYMEDSFTMRGKEYSNGFTLKDHGYACYNVSGKYTSLSFTVGHVDDTTVSNAYLVLYLDGQLAQTMPLESTGTPQNVTLDITGVRQLKFTVQCSNGQVADNHLPLTFQYGLGEVIVE